MKHAKLNIAATAIAVAAVGIAWSLTSGKPSSQPEQSIPEATQVEQPTSDTVNDDSPWNVLAIDGYEVENYDTLESMVDSANVSMLGTVADVRAGRKYTEKDGPETFVSQHIEIVLTNDMLLADSVAAGPVIVEFGPFPQADIKKMMTDLAALNGKQSIFILRQKGAGAPSEGLTSNGEEYDRGVYRLVSSQGLIDDFGGTATAPLAHLDHENNAFLEELVSEPFDLVVNHVDQATD